MDRVREIPYSRILIITDKFFSGSSMLRIVTQPLSETNKEFRIFNDVVPDPPVEKIVNGVKVVLDYKPDCLIAVGAVSYTHLDVYKRQVRGTLYIRKKI